MKIRIYKSTSVLVAVFCFLVFLFSQQSHAQQIIYSQNFNLAYPAWPTGWVSSSDSGWIMDTSIANQSYTWNSKSMSGYSFASGGAMVEISNPDTGVGAKSARYTVTSPSISTIGYDSITIVYGARRTKHFSDSASLISLSWSGDGGSTWDSLPYIENSNTSNWNVINDSVPIALPEGAANRSQIMFRWSAYVFPTPSGTYRFDDVFVKGDSISRDTTKIDSSFSDTLSIMTYNLNNYGYYDGGNCPTQTPLVKNPYLRTVLKYANPDIIGLVKMEASTEAFYTDTLPKEILDSVCNKCYGYGAYTDESGYYKENMLYYNTNRVGLISTTTIYSGDPYISDINLYKLYYKSVNLATTHDTAFINIVLVHDESGSSDSSERAEDIGGAMSWLDSHVTGAGNYIFMGDFNVQGYTEQCYQDMLNPSNSDVKFYDPVNQLGNWSQHPSLFADYLTQSTRGTVDPGDCGATGGMNNRYDQILCSNPVLSGTDSVKYVNGSYTTIGQDGKHVGEAINDTPANTSVPANVLAALYQMSEHLPVMFKLAISTNNDASTGIKPVTALQNFSMSYNSIVSDNLVTTAIEGLVTTSSYGTLSIYNLQGKLVSSMPFDLTQSNNFSLSYLPQGMYIFSITQNYYPIFNGKFIKL